MNIEEKRKQIDQDTRMLNCVNDMLKKMEYRESSKNKRFSYISIDDLLLTFDNGKFMGWSIDSGEDKEEDVCSKEKQALIDAIECKFTSGNAYCEDVYIIEQGNFATRVDVKVKFVDGMRKIYTTFLNPMECFSGYKSSDFIRIIKQAYFRELEC